MNRYLLRIILLSTFSSYGVTLRIIRDASTSPLNNLTAVTLNTANINNSSSENSTDHGSPYWLEQIKHQGTPAFRSDSGYQVFRNVKDFGARGDGISDDTVALNLAISSGQRCKPGSCEESTTSPALVYIPGGTYLVSAPIIDFYYTQIIGNPNDRPVLKATENFTGFAVIDGDPYQPGNAENSAGSLSYKATNVFYRQIRNLILDTTAVAASSNIRAIHWPTAQATSLENLLIRMNDQSGTQHQGLFVESGSGGFMSDLEFYGGLTGALMGSQQFTTRNLWFYNAVEAIEQVFDWGWTYKSVHITNCSVGLNMTNVNPESQNVGSITIIDSFFANTPVGIATSHDSNHWSVSNGSLILENVGFENVQLAVQGTQGWTALPTNSGNLHVQAWGIGHEYAQQGPQDFLGTLPAVTRVASLTAGSDNGTYYERSKPDYRDIPVTNILSVKAGGARGDGVADDTDALQKVLDQAGTNEDQIVFFDAGTYRVTKTLRVPKICKIVGESYATIMSSGAFFADMANPQPVVQVGSPGDVGKVEWSDMIVSTQGSQAGAILIEWNVATTGQPSGMWDVHTRIGGFAGSKLGAAQCGASSSSNVLPSSSNHTNARREAVLSPRFNVGFSVYEGVATPTYVAASELPSSQASSPLSQDSTLQPSSVAPSPSSTLDNSISSINVVPTMTSTIISSISPEVSLPLLTTPIPATTPTFSTETEFDDGLTPLAFSTSAADSTSSASPPPLPSSTSTSSDIPLPNSAPSVSPSPPLSSSYNRTSPEPLGASNSMYAPLNATGNFSSSAGVACMGAFMSMHITKSASGLYMENVWLWTADHDLDAPSQNITVYSGRGLLVESEKGSIWMVGTASEHHSLYQYQLVQTQNIVLGQMQSETAYYQPNSQAGTPFSPVESLNDPNAADLCKNGNGRCDGYGLRIVESQHVAIYGAGLYSFFDNYDGSCAIHTGGTSCQQSIFSIEGSSSDITVYNLNTVGAASMVDRDGTSLAKYSDNVDVFADTIALFRLW